MKMRFFIILGAMCLLAAACLLLFLPSKKQVMSTQTGEFGPSHNTTSAKTKPTKANEVPQEPEEEYTSPVDFASLQSINPDVYAWLEMPGANISYPIVQSQTDDTFYVDHDSDKNANANGAIFTERMYNSLEFTDNVTVLYGHNMNSGTMFGSLQSLYWDEEYLRSNGDMIVYLPDRELHFKAFAALPYSRMHLLHYYQTQKQKAFDLLIDDVYASRELGSVLIEERRPQFGEQVIVLSTCLSGDNRYRYLVFGVCEE